MVRIGHLSDLHLLEADHARRGTADRIRLNYLSFGRPLDAVDRCARLRRSLADVRRLGLDHLVLTGDLTEDGLASQFEVLADLLLESRIDPAQVTLVPGNHDAYTDPCAWRRALDGPLRPFRRTSTPGIPVRVGTVLLVPISTTIEQPYTRAAGAMDPRDLTKLDVLARSRWVRGQPLVVAQHHPPVGSRVKPWHWAHGLLNAASSLALLVEHAGLHVLHGHTHRSRIRAVVPDRTPQVFSAGAVVDNDEPLSIVEAVGARLLAVEVPRTDRERPEIGPFVMGSGVFDQKLTSLSRVCHPSA